MPASTDVPADPAPPPPTPVAQAVAAVAPTVQAVAQTTQAAAQTVTTATKQAQATVQQTAQQVTVSPRKAIYRGRQFAIGYALLVMVLGFMAGMARRYKVLPGDVGITRFIQHPNNAPYDTVMKLVSEMGWQWPSVITRLTATGLIWSAGFRLEGAFVAATWSGDIVTVLIKETVGRPRPTRDLVKVSYTLGEHSFPSGHVVHYVTFYGFLFYIFLVHLKDGKWRNAVLTLLALIVLLIGPSRVYQGAHWPSDVAAAYVVGSLWLAVQIIAYVEFKSRFQIHTHWPFLVSRSRKV
jgi:membrane-associated phospholipid phosphatase